MGKPGPPTYFGPFSSGRTDAWLSQGLVWVRTVHVRIGGQTRVLISRLVGLVASGAFEPKDILTQREPVTGDFRATDTPVRNLPITPDKLVR